ncbi:uncharacterized protein [Euphorbia lathyris]|uniref:uncharacterized protein n=1 Tax=Euphorbia lathyris TaxID=212925 RepID=UPI0033142996
MEMNNKDREIASATAHQPHSNHFLIKEEKDQPNAAIAAKSVGAITPSNHAPALNQQYPSAPQNNAEQPAPIPNPWASSQSPPPLSANQLHQLPHFALNQHGYPPPNQPQSFWLPHQHPGVNAPPFFHPFSPLGTVNANWQPSALLGSGTSLNDHTQVPNPHNQVGYTYPACPGPWDPSSWWGQVQQSRPPFPYTFPGSYGQFSLHHPMMPPCSTPAEQLSERGNIKPSAKLSQKHQKLWEAQSAENGKLWTIIDQLQSEIANFKSRVEKLEEDVSSLKQATAEPITHVTSTAVSGQPSKRGRPRKSAASADALPSLDESQPCTQGRKLKTPIFEKVILHKAENNVKPVHLTALAQQGKEKVTREGKGLNCSVTNGSNATMPAFHNQNAIMQMGGVDSNSLEMKNNKDKVADTNDAFAILAKGMDHRTALASCHAARDNRSLGWPYAILPQGNGNIMANMNPQRFYNNSSLIKHGEKVISGWGLANEGDACDELDDAKAKDDNDEEMEDDESSSGEEIAC